MQESTRAIVPLSRARRYSSRIFKPSYQQVLEYRDWKSLRSAALSRLAADVRHFRNTGRISWRTVFRYLLILVTLVFLCSVPLAVVFAYWALAISLLRRASVTKKVVFAIAGIFIAILFGGVYL